MRAPDDLNTGKYKARLSGWRSLTTTILALNPEFEFSKVAEQGQELSIARGLRSMQF